MLVPVLLSGGSGSRLWPVSRASYPKQFVNLVDEQSSLLQQTAARVSGLGVVSSGWIVVANQEHRFLVAQQLQQAQASVEAIILEPEAKNTAPAIALAAFEALSRYPKARLLIQTADHVIPDQAVLREVFTRAYQSPHALVTFGVTPTRPETGYGYIKTGKPAGDQCYAVDRFVEKPDAGTAQDYLDSGEYLWNSGMFMLDATTYLQELQRLCPLIHQACEAAWQGRTQDQDFVRIAPAAFAESPSESIDYAVMERTDQAHVIPLTTAWSDLGAWDAVPDHLPKDEQGNALRGDGQVHNCTDTLVYSQSRHVSCVGVDNLAVIETADAVLVLNRDCAQHVKSVLEQLREQGRREADSHVVGHRPWGNYTSLAMADRFQVKRIEVEPGASLSLQMHHHRAEHWIVVHGTAEVVNGDETLLLTENESTYIPVGQRHRLTNPGRVPLVLIEVQSGSYLGEDDIVRYDDAFGRCNG